MLMIKTIVWSTEQIILSILVFILALLIITIFLKIALGIIDKAKNTEFKDVFITTLLIVIVLFIFGLFGLLVLIIGILVAFALISTRHSISYGMAILVAILAFVIYIIVLVVIMILLGITIALI
ncbi:MAG: hypothetical protein ACTSQJ_19340 [Promethearchaeota archaeon]